MNPTSMTLLLAEDEQAHATLIVRNLKRSGITNDILHFSDGQQLLDHIRNNDRNDNDRLLILLDINMPILSGMETLKNLKGSDHSRHIPVIMLTTTDDQQEVDQCYKLGCNAYVTKPVEPSEFSRVIRELGMFIELVATPRVN